jgi:alkanesulfonate monooxygenase SsuD/methylene tetrahydromethanopterin reductase-like flavin-dependent oxidoreductase (luciferase family)
MEFALQVNGTYPEVLAAARWAEDRGLAALAVPDHYVLSRDEEGIAIPALDAFAMLAGLARDTTVIPLAVLVSPITFRHPAVLLKSAITIDHLSGGRMALGVGTGWLDIEHHLFGLPFPERGERFAMLEEALGYLRAALDRAPGGFEGERYRLEGFDMHPRPIGRLPLIVGGTGAVRTPALAGRYADELNAYPAPEDEMRARVGRARDAAAAAGRDPDALLISSAGQVTAAATEAGYRDLVARLAAEAGIEVEELEAAFERRGTPRGTYEQVAGHLADLERAGVRRFYLQVRADFARDATAELLAAIDGPSG